MGESTIATRDALFVSVEGGTRRRLDPGPTPIVFGRGSKPQISLCHLDQTSVSREAGSFLHEDGLWWVSNLSDKHALYVAVPDDSPEPIAVRNGDRVASRVISPPGLVLQVPMGARRITIAVTTERLPPDPLPTPSTDEDGDPTTPRYSLSPHTRFLLAGKFLSRGPSGPILGDEETAILINELRGNDEVTRPAVMAAAKKARDLLDAHGVPGLRGQGATSRVRRDLLAWGYLTEADARWIRART